MSLEKMLTEMGDNGLRRDAFSLSGMHSETTPRHHYQHVLFFLIIYSLMVYLHTLATLFPSNMMLARGFTQMGSNN